MNRWLLVVIGVLFATLGLATQADATDSRLGQSVRPLQCNYTIIETGNGNVNDVDCEPFRPVIVDTNPNNGRPIIRGIYDATHTQTLRFLFRGIWYEAGVDSRVTLNGNVWTLSFEDLSEPLPEDDYAITVEATMDSGDVFTDEAVIVVTETVLPPDQESSGGGDGNDSESEIIPGVPDTGFNRAAFVLLGFILVGGIVILLMSGLWRLKLRLSK